MMRSLFGYFAKGLAIVIPLAVIGYIFHAIVAFAHAVFPVLHPLAALAAAIAAVTIVGVLFNSQIARAGHRLIMHRLRTRPVFANMYTAIQSALASVARRERAFDEPVWVASGRDADEYRLGFLTQHDLSAVDLEGYVSVYIPDAFTFSGVTTTVPKEYIRPAAMDRTQAFAFASSGGIVMKEMQKERNEAAENANTASDPHDPAQ